MGWPYHLEQLGSRVLFPLPERASSVKICLRRLRPVNQMGWRLSYLSAVQLGHILWDHKKRPRPLARTCGMRMVIQAVEPYPGLLMMPLSMAGTLTLRATAATSTISTISHLETSLLWLITIRVILHSAGWWCGVRASPTQMSTTVALMLSKQKVSWQLEVLAEQAAPLLYNCWGLSVCFVSILASLA